MDDQKELRDFLQDALIKGRLRNPSFSLRALAQRAGLSPSALSEILNGKRRVSSSLAQNILDKLGAAPDQTEEIIHAFNKKNLSKPKQQLSVDQFYLISEWYHFAILSLAETEDFSDDPDWIAHRLNLGLPLVVKALERLERLGALRRNRKGKLEASGIQLSTPDEIANRGLRLQHAEMLEKARDSLERNKIEERDFLGVTMALNPEDLPLAKKLLREFVGKFCNRLEQGRKKEVYRLNLQFIPLTEVKEGEP